MTMTNMSNMESMQVLQIEEFLNERNLVVCRRYHARLSKQACKNYRARNPDACRGCTSRNQFRVHGSWTREGILQALENYARGKERPVTLEEFKDEFGLNFNTIKREWGSWKDLCMAAGLPFGRRREHKAQNSSGSKSNNRQITVDLKELPELYEALNEAANESGRELEMQIVCILKGWFA